MRRNRYRFEQLCKLVPELRTIYRDVIRVTSFLALEDPRQTTQDDTDYIWYVLFKPRLAKLVGWYATESPERARESDAYTAAYDFLYNALAPSQETLPGSGCDEDYLDDDQEFADSYVTSGELLSIIVERLSLPKTDAYMDRLTTI